MSVITFFDGLGLAVFDGLLFGRGVPSKTLVTLICRPHDAVLLGPPTAVSRPRSPILGVMRRRVRRQLVCLRPIPLPFRHRHQAARPALGDLTLIHGRDRQMHGQFAVDGADIVRGADHAGQFQIVMRFKQRPETAVRLLDFEIELRSPK